MCTFKLSPSASVELEASTTTVSPALACDGAVNAAIGAVFIGVTLTGLTVIVIVSVAVAPSLSATVNKKVNVCTSVTSATSNPVVCAVGF